MNPSKAFKRLDDLNTEPATIPPEMANLIAHPPRLKNLLPMPGLPLALIEQQQVDELVDSLPSLQEQLKTAVKEAMVTPRQWTVETANIELMSIAAKEPNFAKTPSPTQWGERIGCVKSLVAKTPFYKACRDKLGKRRKPKAVPLTKQIENVKGQNDQALQGLVGEQTADQRTDDRRRRHAPVKHD
jgi:hypothetical protein